MSSSASSHDHFLLHPSHDLPIRRKIMYVVDRASLNKLIQCIFTCRYCFPLSIRKLCNTFSGFYCSTPGGGWEFFSSQPYPKRFWGPPRLLSNGYRVLFLGGKAAWAWSWSLTSIWCRGQEYVELYLHFPNTASWRDAQLSAGATLSFSLLALNNIATFIL
jgi:hypothetical protein